MLTIQKSDDSVSAVNILPCRIQHNGPAKVTKRHWAPSTTSNGSKIAYFRGRKLKGKELKLPDGYTGVAVKPTDRTLPKQFLPVASEDSDIEEEQDSEPVRILESASKFNEITVWGHDQIPTTDDPFVKGVEEWIAIAQAVHGNARLDDVHDQ